MRATRTRTATVNKRRILLPAAGARLHTGMLFLYCLKLTIYIWNFELQFTRIRIQKSQRSTNISMHLLSALLHKAIVPCQFSSLTFTKIFCVRL